MATQNTLSLISSFTHNTIPQLLKSGHLQTTLARDQGHICSITTSDRLKWCSNYPIKRNVSSCKYISRPDQLQLQYMPEDMVVKHTKLVDVIRELISNNIHDVKFDDLLLVDALQRLGLDYHYEDEIQLILEQCYLQFNNKDFIDHHNLYQVSLCFRILRQKGFRVSADVFELFKGKDARFMENLKYDTRGLMELYEASHLCIEGENILDEATLFSKRMLQKTLNFLDDKEAKRVKFTLENPHRRNLTSFSLFNSPNYDFDAIIFKEAVERNHLMVQSIRKMEINEILRWWKDLGLGQDLKLARNQPLKWYIVPMVSLSNPNLSQQRIDLTKIVSIIYILDDIFDIYGTLNELTLLTEAVNMWDINAIDQFPYYLKSSFRALYDTTNDIACRVYEKYRFNPIKTFKKSWARLCEAFLVEAQWFSSRHIPKSEEYLKNGIVSSGVHVFLVHMFFLLGDGTTEEYASLIDNNPDVVLSVSKILRLTDDLEAEQDKNQDDRDGSYVKCFLMEHEYCSVKTAREHVEKMISDSWKCLNKECISPNPFSENFLKGSINLARLVPSMYNYNNNNSFELIEEYIKSIL